MAASSNVHDAIQLAHELYVLCDRFEKYKQVFCRCFHKWTSQCVKVKLGGFVDRGNVLGPKPGNNFFERSAPQPSRRWFFKKATLAFGKLLALDAYKK